MRATALRNVYFVHELPIPPKDLALASLVTEPESRAALRNVMERLEGDETSKVLLSIMTHFPCELYLQGVGSSPQTPNVGIIDESVGAVSNLQTEILGKALGVWQILLSVQALRSLQEMSVQDG